MNVNVLATQRDLCHSDGVNLMEEPKITVRMAPPGTPQQQVIAELWQQWLKERKFPDDSFSSAECHWAVTNFSMYLTDHFEEYKTLVSGGPAAMQLLAEYHVDGYKEMKKELLNPHPPPESPC